MFYLFSDIPMKMQETTPKGKHTGCRQGLGCENSGLWVGFWVKGLQKLCRLRVRGFDRVLRRF